MNGGMYGGMNGGMYRRLNSGSSDRVCVPFGGGGGGGGCRRLMAKHGQRRRLVEGLITDGLLQECNRRLAELEAQDAAVQW
jgi:hypothetical protein